MINSQSAKRRRFEAPIKQSKLHQFFKTPAQESDNLLVKLSQSVKQSDQTEFARHGKKLVDVPLTEVRKRNIGSEIPKRVVSNTAYVKNKMVHDKSSNKLLTVQKMKCTPGKQTDINPFSTNSYQQDMDLSGLLPSKTLKKCLQKAKLNSNTPGSLDGIDHANDIIGKLPDKPKNDTTNNVRSTAAPIILNQRSDIEDRSVSKYNPIDPSALKPSNQFNFIALDSLDIDTNDFATLPCSNIIGKPPGNLKYDATNNAKSNTAPNIVDKINDTENRSASKFHRIDPSAIKPLNQFNFIALDSLDIDTNDFATLPCSNIIGKPPGNLKYDATNNAKSNTAPNIVNKINDTENRSASKFHRDRIDPSAIKPLNQFNCIALDSLDIDTIDFMTLPCSPIIGKPPNSSKPQANVIPNNQSVSKSNTVDSSRIESRSSGTPAVDTKYREPTTGKKVSGIPGNCMEDNSLSHTIDFESLPCSPVIKVRNRAKEQSRNNKFSLVGEADFSQTEFESLPCSTVIAPLWSNPRSRSNVNGHNGDIILTCGPNIREVCSGSKPVIAEVPIITEPHQSNIERTYCNTVESILQDRSIAPKIVEPVISCPLKLFEDSSNSSMEGDLFNEEKTTKTCETNQFEDLVKIDDTFCDNQNYGNCDSTSVNSNEANDGDDFSLSGVLDVMKGPNSVFIGS